MAVGANSVGIERREKQIPSSLLCSVPLQNPFCSLSVLFFCSETFQTPSVLLSFLSPSPSHPHRPTSILHLPLPPPLNPNLISRRPSDTAVLPCGRNALQPVGGVAAGVGGRGGGRDYGGVEEGDEGEDVAGDCDGGGDSVGGVGEVDGVEAEALGLARSGDSEGGRVGRGGGREGRGRRENEAVGEAGKGHLGGDGPGGELLGEGGSERGHIEVGLGGRRSGSLLGDAVGGGPREEPLELPLGMDGAGEDAGGGG